MIPGYDMISGYDTRLCFRWCCILYKCCLVELTVVMEMLFICTGQ